MSLTLLKSADKALATKMKLFSFPLNTSHSTHVTQYQLNVPVLVQEERGSGWKAVKQKERSDWEHQTALEPSF